MTGWATQLIHIHTGLRISDSVVILYRFLVCARSTRKILLYILLFNVKQQFKNFSVLTTLRIHKNIRNYVNVKTWSYCNVCLYSLPLRLSHPPHSSSPHAVGGTTPLSSVRRGRTGWWVRGSPVCGPRPDPVYLCYCMQLRCAPRREPGRGRGECSGIRRAGRHCGAPYTLAWLLSRAGH